MRRAEKFSVRSQKPFHKNLMFDHLVWFREVGRADIFSACLIAFPHYKESELLQKFILHILPLLHFLSVFSSSPSFLLSFFTFFSSLYLLSHLFFLHFFFFTSSRFNFLLFFSLSSPSPSYFHLFLFVFSLISIPSSSLFFLSTPPPISLYLLCDPPSLLSFCYPLLFHIFFSSFINCSLPSFCSYFPSVADPPARTHNFVSSPLFFKS